MLNWHNNENPTEQFLGIMFGADFITGHGTFQIQYPTRFQYDAIIYF